MRKQLTTFQRKYEKIHFVTFFQLLTCDTLWASWRLPSWPCTWWLSPWRKPRLTATTRGPDTTGLTMYRLTVSIDEASSLPFCLRPVVSANDQTLLSLRKYSKNVCILRSLTYPWLEYVILKGNRCIFYFISPLVNKLEIRDFSVNMLLRNNQLRYFFPGPQLLRR